MKWIFLCLLTGCGTVPLGLVYSEQGQSKEQRAADMGVCIEQSRAALDTPERVAAARLAGATLIGLPGAITDERTLYRQLFAGCMVAKGYRVEAPK